MASDEELEKKLKELRDQLEKILELNKPQLDKIDEWIDLAKKAQTARQAWDQAETVDKGKAHNNYIEAKNLFENAIRSAKEGDDETLKQAANFIENRSKNNDILDYAKKEFLLADQSREKHYKDMSDGELLAEILFKIFGLLGAGTHGLQYLYNQAEEAKALKDLTEKHAVKNSNTDLFEAKQDLDVEDLDTVDDKAKIGYIEPDTDDDFIQGIDEDVDFESEDVIQRGENVAEEFYKVNLFSARSGDPDPAALNASYNPLKESQLANYKPLPRGIKPTEEQEAAAKASLLKGIKAK